MQNIEFSDIEITAGYWKTRQDINSKVTLKSVYERFRETHRFDALKCDWKDGEPEKVFKNQKAPLLRPRDTLK